MSKYYIGIDGGGTKTLGVLWDKNFKEVKRIVTGFSSFAVNEQQAKENLEENINKLTNNLNGEIKILIGLSGISVLKNVNEYELYLSKKYNSKIKLITDGLLALYSINSSGNKIMAIGGTGSIVYSIDKNEVVNKMGGFGHFLGDEGSAYHATIKAFKHVIFIYESTNKYDDFSRKLMSELQLTNVDDLKGKVYGVSKKDIAKNAIIINDLALKGNDVAISILEKEGECLAKKIINIYKKNSFDEVVTIALRGSFVNNSVFVKESVIKHLKLNGIDFILEQIENEPVLGAYNFFKNNNGEK